MNHKKTLYFVGLLITVISLVYLSDILLNNITLLSIENFQLTHLIYCALGILIVILGHAILAFSWHLILHKHNKDFHIKQAFIIIGLSQLIKYTPGNFAHLLGRVILAKQWFKKTVIFQSMLIESLLLIFVAGILALTWSPIYTYIPLLFDIKIIISFVILLVIVSYVLTFYLEKVKVLYKQINLKHISTISVLYFLSFALYGLVIYTLFVNIYHVHDITLWQCIVAFAISFLAGYVLPGAPGGLGVREAIFILLLSTQLVNQGVILQVIIVTRVLSIIGDFVTFFIASLFKSQISFIKTS